MSRSQLLLFLFRRIYENANVGILILSSNMLHKSFNGPFARKGITNRGSTTSAKISLKIVLELWSWLFRVLVLCIFSSFTTPSNLFAVPKILARVMKFHIRNAHRHLIREIYSLFRRKAGIGFLRLRADSSSF